jgi:hypothetical protein
VVTVVIDANAIVKRSWHLDSAAWRLLRYRGRAQLDRIIVPEIVVREAVGRYRGELTAASERGRTVVTDLRRLRVSTPSLPTIDIDSTVDGYERGLREALKAARARIAEPPITVIDLADRAIARRRPFNEKGAGFRDAAIWEQVIHQATEPYSGHLVFVSGDGCFSGSDGLHPDLARDVAERAPSGSVRLCRTLDEYVRSVGASDPDLAAEVAELVEDESDQVAANIRTAIEGMRWRTDQPQADVVVEAAHHLVIIRVTGVTVTDEAPQALVELDIEIDADLYIEPWERETYGPYVTGSATLSTSGTVAYDLDAKTLDDFVVSEPYFDLEDWLDWHLQ